jgi:hypothetical protein
MPPLRPSCQPDRSPSYSLSLSRAQFSETLQAAPEPAAPAPVSAPTTPASLPTAGELKELLHVTRRAQAPVPPSICAPARVCAATRRSKIIVVVRSSSIEHGSNQCRSIMTTLPATAAACQQRWAGYRRVVRCHIAPPCLGQTNKVREHAYTCARVHAPCRVLNRCMQR